LYERLKELLAPGFFPDNFLKAARLAEEASWQTEHPLGLYVFSRILLSLGDEWASDEQGIETQAAERMAEIMTPPIHAYIESGILGMTREEEVSHLDSLILAFLRWRAG
jgi:hypothetical protein